MNKTLCQFFEWYLPDDASLWRQLASEAPHLAAAGFTDIWLPPATKGAGGIHDVGYGVYDLYDLGEFDQKGSIPTKYGTKSEYLNAIEALHSHQLSVIADIVLNQRLGADYPEEVSATSDTPANRNQPDAAPAVISAWTGFNFPGRADKYSDFHWNHNHFCGVDWDSHQKQNHIYLLKDKSWASNVDLEYGNYDYLMGADVDVENPEVIAELDHWGHWYLETTHVDGFRLDAVKHISFEFFTHWLGKLRQDFHQPLWSVGEYWQPDPRALTNYLETSGDTMNLFDVPLHYNFMRASLDARNFDLRQIFDNSLLASHPDQSVTFVDNHDTQPGQPLSSWVAGWFKPIAYALILLRQAATPCVFYGDLYGIPHDHIDPVGDPLWRLIALRYERAYGEQHDYFDDPHLVGWTLGGDSNHPDSGLAVVLSSDAGGAKFMSLGPQFAGQTFIDLLANHPAKITLDENGSANFPCNGGSVSVWGLAPKS